ncbi:MAG: glycosyltransferase family 2 protein [Paracoccus sp. (in: a-proteobacteria)]|nr:glycosyltransferase family 2 protein [Paracoccus sp. (in: a-proteobacteria)]
MTAAETRLPRPNEVLAVVPALNEERAIRACLLSLLEGYAPEAAPQIVVADGGSSDRTRAIVAEIARAHKGVRLIDNPARLQSAGLNEAVRECALPRHRVLVRADAHAHYPPRYLMDAAEALHRSGAASVVVPMDSVANGCFARAAAWVVDTPLGSGGAAHRGGRRSGFVDHGHHAAMDLGWFRRIGGYDPLFSHNEDAEFDHRLRMAGGTIWMEAGLRLDYQMRPSLRALARQYWNYGRGRARTVTKHGVRPRLRQLAPAVNLLLIALGAAVAAAGALVGSGAALAFGLAWPALYAGVLLGVSVAAALSMRSLCGLWAGPALGAMHLPWGAGFLTGLWTYSRQGGAR